MASRAVKNGYQQAMLLMVHMEYSSNAVQVFKTVDPFGIKLPEVLISVVVSGLTSSK